MLYLEGAKGKKLNVRGTAKLKKLPVGWLQVGSATVDPTFAWVKNFPNVEVLSTGKTNLTSTANFAGLKKLQALTVQLGSKQVDLGTIAKLPNLQGFGLTGTSKQSLTPLKKSKSLKGINLMAFSEMKLKKGQTYKPPASLIKKYGVPTAQMVIGWDVKFAPVKSVKSNGTGAAILTASRNTKLGKIIVSHSITLTMSTSGKVNFFRPVVAAKSISAGQVVTAKKSEANKTSGWSNVITKCTYQWQRNTTNIKGANKLAYKATTADKGKTLRLKTTCYTGSEVKKAYGFTTNTKYSGAVKVAK